MDWTTLAEELGPQPAAYHTRPYNFPKPRPVERFPHGEIECRDGSFRPANVGDVTICGDPQWRERRYVPQP